MTAPIHCGSPTRSKLRSPNMALAAIAACARRSIFLRANYASSLNAFAAPARRRSQSSRPAALTEWPHGKKLRNTLSSLKGRGPPRDRLVAGRCSDLPHRRQLRLATPATDEGPAWDGTQDPPLGAALCTFSSNKNAANFEVRCARSRAHCGGWSAGDRLWLLAC